MSNVLFPSPPAYDESAHLPVYDDVVIANRLQQLEKRLQKHIADVLKHNDVAVTEKAQKMVENILLIFEKRFDDLGEDVRQKMDAFRDWSARLGAGEQTIIEMDKKIAKIAIMSSIIVIIGIFLALFLMLLYGANYYVNRK